MAEGVLSIELEVKVQGENDPDELRQGLADMLRAQFPGVIEVTISVQSGEQPPGEE